MYTFIKPIRKITPSFKTSINPNKIKQIEHYDFGESRIVTSIHVKGFLIFSVAKNYDTFIKIIPLNKNYKKHIFFTSSEVNVFKAKDHNVFCGCENGRILILSLGRITSLKRFVKHSNSIEHLFIKNDEIISGHSDGSVISARLKGKSKDDIKVLIPANNKKLLLIQDNLVVYKSKDIQIWSILKGLLLKSLPLNSDIVTSIAMKANFIAYGTNKGEIKIISLFNGNNIILNISELPIPGFTFEHIDNSVRSLFILGNMMITRSKRNHRDNINFWSFNDGKLLKTIEQNISSDMTISDGIIIKTRHRYDDYSDEFTFYVDVYSF